MHGGDPKDNLIFRIVLLLSMLFFPNGSAVSERLPIKPYTTADGLARDTITRIFQDSKGFLWFCTSEGLSRFDGYGFVNYGIDQGLPHRFVNHMFETRSGTYWVATEDGLCRLNLDASIQSSGGAGGSRSRFVVYRPGDDAAARNITSISEDHEGSIWCGTLNGLYRLVQINGEWVCSFVDIVRSEEAGIPRQVLALIKDRHGSLWISSPAGLFRRRTDGTVEAFSAKEGLPVKTVTSALMEDRDGHIWVGTSAGLYRLVREPEPGRRVVERSYTMNDGLTSNFIVSLAQSVNGRLWVAGNGLNELMPEANNGGRAFRNYTRANGLSDESISALAGDSYGNLWVGTESGGVMKLAANGLTTYGEADGVKGFRVSQIWEDKAGNLCVITGQGYLNYFDAGRFKAARLVLPKGIAYPGWGWYQTMLQDSRGEWWWPTAGGLVRYPRLSNIEQISRVAPKAVYTSRDGLPGNELFRLFEDSRGDLWVSTLDRPEASLTRWDRKTGKFHRYSLADGGPPSAPTAFCENASGTLWIGLYEGGLLRYADGRFTLFSEAHGLPSGFVRGLFLDHAGRLWVATTVGGVARIDDPESEHPRFTRYTTAEGLSSNQATCVTEDQWGRIYIGTGRGINRLDPDSGHIKHYTTADGLSNNYISVSYRDRTGALWFGTLQGTSRLLPELDDPAAPPPIIITALRAAGESYPVSDLGVIAIAGPELTVGRNQIQIDYASISMAVGEILRYQYKLEGTSGDWSAPTDQRTVNYPNLAPGDYRFLVRAISGDGALSLSPASVQFRIIPPVWRRWWFLAICGLIIGAAVLGFARSRYERLKTLRESENRFRTLAETASDAIITIDEQSQIILVNQAAERIFGYTRLEMLGKELTMLMPEYLRHLHQAGFARYKATGKRHLAWEAIELPGLHKNGFEIPLEVSFGEFTRKDKRFFTGIARDITERKRAEAEARHAEEALRRSREERFVELERVRRRIATDLHDDIGSSLTRISLLSEVAQRQVDGGQSRVIQPLSLIARLSRELVDSMSDIVWAINPNKDHLSDLSQRMRHFASDVFTAREIDFDFHGPDLEQNLKVGANFRRELFLLFKEGINNIVRHSSCSQATIEFGAQADGLRLILKDNGRGFDVHQKSSGHGLTSMLERTRGLGGKFEVASREGEGTTLAFTIPLNQDQAS